MSKVENIATLAAVLATENPTKAIVPHIVARDCAALISLARAAQRVALTRCNGIERWNDQAKMRLASLTEEDEARLDKATDRTRAKAGEIAAKYGATAEVGGDPRGYVLRLRLASGRSNSFAGEGWGIEG